MKISIEIEVDATPASTWQAWVTPTDITQWNFASDEWNCPTADIDLKIGGSFSYRMEAKDGSMGFDFEGEFTQVEPLKSIHYKLEDDRTVSIEFVEIANGTKLIETFEAEDENSAEQQKQGWLCILANFKNYVENKDKINRKQVGLEDE